MARARRLQISSPGRIPNVVVGLDIPSGDTIDPASITVTSTISDYLSGANAGVNGSTETVDEQDYIAGHAIVFDLVCLTGAPEFDENDPQYVLIDYNTVNADEQRLRYQKQIEVYPYIPIP